MATEYFPEKEVQLHDLSFRPMISPAQIAQRVSEIGDALAAQYGDKKPIFISILSGAFVFASDLIRAFNAPCEISFVKLASYQGTQSSGGVQVVMGLQKSLRDRHVIVVEDIIDTGRTLHYFIELLQQESPASVCTVAFLRKPEAACFDVQMDYVGFDIPDKFVVGYGLDYDDLGRNLSGVYTL